MSEELGNRPIEKIKCEICFHRKDEHGELAGSGCCFHSTAYFDNPSLGCFCPGFRAEYAIRSRDAEIAKLSAELASLRARPQEPGLEYSARDLQQVYDRINEVRWRHDANYDPSEPSDDRCQVCDTVTPCWTRQKMNEAKDILDFESACECCLRQRGDTTEGVCQECLDNHGQEELPFACPFAPSCPLSDPEQQEFKTFTVFRTGDLSETHDENQAPVGPDVPSFWGVVFPDGTCTLRWASVVAATSVWASFDDAMKVHGHFEPRYGTRLEWTSGPLSDPEGET